MRVSSMMRSSRRASASRTSCARGRRAARGQPGGVVGGVAHVPPAPAVQVAVGAGPDAPPVRAAPVADVVPAAGVRRRRPSWRSRTSRSPAAAERRVGGQVAVGHRVVVGRPGARRGARARASRVPGRQRQAVDADVVGPGRQRGVQRGRPVGVRLPRRAEDEVEADVLEARRARLGGRRLRAAGRVRALRARRARAGATLCIPSDTRVTPCSRSSASAGRVDATRGWPRPSPRRRAPSPRRSSTARRMRTRSAGGQQRRRAAAEEDRRRRRRGRRAARAPRARPRRSRRPRTRAGVAAAQLGRRVGVEVAVRAARRAERHVHVDAQHARDRTAPAAAYTAPRRSAALATDAHTRERRSPWTASAAPSSSSPSMPDGRARSGSIRPPAPSGGRSRWRPSWAWTPIARPRCSTPRWSSSTRAIATGSATRSQRAFETGTLDGLELRAVRADGTTRWFAVRGRLEDDALGLGPGAHRRRPRRRGGALAPRRPRGARRALRRRAGRAGARSTPTCATSGSTRRWPR